jgi:hypothetical protein
MPIVVSGVLLLRAAARMPSRSEVSPRPESFPRLVAGALALFLAARIGSLATSYRHPAWARVDTPAGTVLVTEPVAAATRASLGDLAARVPSGGTIAGFPEAGFFNWTLGRKNPLAQDQFFPGLLDESAEKEAISRLASRPPDAVVLVNVLTIGHGPTAFGRDYLARLARFLDEEFETAAVHGRGASPEPRIGDRDFFVEVRVPKAVAGRLVTTSPCGGGSASPGARRATPCGDDASRSPAR